MSLSWYVKVLNPEYSVITASLSKSEVANRPL